MKNVFLLISLLVLISSSAESASVGELIENADVGVSVNMDGTVSFLNNRELGSYGDDYYYDDDEADDLLYDDDGITLRQLQEPYNVNIRGTIQVTFWGADAVPGRDNPYRNGVTSKPTQADINRFFDVTEQFFLDSFEDFAMTRGKIAGFRMGYLMSQYYPAADETDGQAKFLISFRAQPSIFPEYNLSARRVNNVMRMMNFVPYITEYLWSGDDNIWYESQAMRYAGILRNSV